MAVTMLIGNSPKASLSLFAPQYTMTAVIANEFTEAADPLYLNALVEIGLVLFLITITINTLSRLLIWRVGAERAARAVRPVAVICGDQTRSAAVASMLLRAGHDARLVMGGMVDWIERGYPVEKQAVPA